MARSSCGAGGGVQPLLIAFSIAASNSFVVTNPQSQRIVRSMHISNFSIAALMLIGAMSGGTQMSLAQNLNDVPVSAPIDTDSAGRAGDVATHSVVRLICVIKAR